jgi:hypothetical protein
MTTFSSNLIFDDILCSAFFTEMFQYFEFKDIVNLLKVCGSLRSVKAIYNNYMPSFEFRISKEYVFDIYSSDHLFDKWFMPFEPFNNLCISNELFDKLHFFPNSIDYIKIWKKGLNHILITNYLDSHRVCSSLSCLNNIKIKEITLNINNHKNYYGLNNYNLVKRLILSNQTNNHISFDLIELEKFKNLESLELLDNVTIILSNHDFENTKFDCVKLLRIGKNAFYDQNILKIFPNLEKLVCKDYIQLFSYMPINLHLSLINTNLIYPNEIYTKVKYLYLETKLKNQDFTKFTILEELTCKYNHIPDEYFRFPENLKKFNLIINNDTFIPHGKIKHLCKSLLQYKNCKIKISYKSGNKTRYCKI